MSILRQEKKLLDIFHPHLVPRINVNSYHSPDAYTPRIQNVITEFTLLHNELKTVKKVNHCFWISITTILNGKRNARTRTWNVFYTHLNLFIYCNYLCELFLIRNWIKEHFDNFIYIGNWYRKLPRGNIIKACFYLVIWIYS